jgi:hypothetical protein
MSLILFRVTCSGIFSVIGNSSYWKKRRHPKGDLVAFESNVEVYLMFRESLVDSVQNLHLTRLRQPHSSLSSMTLSFPFN